MQKVFNFKLDKNVKIKIYLKLTNSNNNKDLKCSLAATVFQLDGNLWKDIAGGQCLDIIPQYLDNIKDIKQRKLLNILYLVWKNHHLNDLKAWCKHQNYGEHLATKVKLYHLRGNELYDKLSQIRDLPPKYLKVTSQGLKKVLIELYERSTFHHGKQGIEVKTTSWIPYDPIYSPEGLLGRVCPICGAQYGHSWYYKPLPQHTVYFITKLCNKGI